METKKIISRNLYHQVFDFNKYEPDYSYTPWKEGESIHSVHTLSDLIRLLESAQGKNIEVDARYFSVTKNGKVCRESAGKDKFVKAVKSTKRFKEALDTFALEAYDGNSVGEETIPLLGGPFNKNLYYLDYVKMSNAGFYAYHNDPFVRRTVQIIKDFTVGKGYRVDCKNKKALAIWNMFSEANNFDVMIDNISIETPINGEVMIQWLPAGQAKIHYQIPVDKMELGIIPRVRMIDPSTIWEIVTYPEDITRVLYYMQIFPTQYQIYTAEDVPSTKFIYQQIPAAEVDHYKVNSFHNEKRGRSDIYAGLGYSKRLRDCINYAIIKDLKNASWAIDTTIDGSDTDIQNYINAQSSLGTIPPAGSEFVHSSVVKRDYVTASGASAADSQSFEWVLSAYCSAVGIPISYFGTHLQNSGTRASTIVSTEPVAKLFEGRQRFIERIILNTSKKLFRMFGLEADLEVTFPEIATQDRTAKLRDLSIADGKWLSSKRCATIASKEFGITDYDYEKEIAEIKKEQGVTEELSSPEMANSPIADLAKSALTSDERVKIKNENT